MRLWREMFSKEEKTGLSLRLVTVEPSQRVPTLDQDSAQAISTLQSHPGFLYLLAKLKFHRQLLKENLATNRQASLEDVVVLQSGIAWAGWLQAELDKAIGFKAAAPTAPSATELSVFEESQRQLEVLR